MTSSEEYIIHGQNLCYKIGHRNLLNNIHIKIKKGEHWLLFGMNGSGKTTLLSILAGFRQPTHGTLHVFGEPFTKENILTNRKRIGWISSSFFDDRYSNEQVLDIVLSGKFGSYGLDFEIEGSDFRRAKKLLTSLGLEQKMYSNYNQLSKGQRQNTLIARTFMAEPEILILDEPYSGLDIIAKNSFRQTLEYLMTSTDMTIIYVTHDIQEMNTVLFPNTLLLRNGNVFSQGKTTDLLTSEILSRFFKADVKVTRDNENNMALALDQEIDFTPFIHY